MALFRIPCYYDYHERAEVLVVADTAGEAVAKVKAVVAQHIPVEAVTAGDIYDRDLDYVELPLCAPGQAATFYGRFAPKLDYSAVAEVTGDFYFNDGCDC